jgi:23S rRNA pseudouridine1911/1915/1917 synthase
MKICYTVNLNEAGMSLKLILKNKLFVSSRLIHKLKISDSIFVNENLVYVNYILQEGDHICLDLDNMNSVIQTPKFLEKFNEYKIDLDILYEDDYLIIVNKPKNMYIHPCSNDHDTTLSNAVASYLQTKEIYNIHIITRLDKNTSGICIFAKSEYIQELFMQKKEEVKLVKEYICVVSGILENDHGIIQKNIARKPGSIIVRCIDEKGDFAKTEYFVIKKFKDKNYTLVKIILHTGRTHQIRVHMASISHVLLGDSLYASEYNVENITKYIDRVALHCIKVSFFHPITNELILINSPIPDDIQNIIK